MKIIIAGAGSVGKHLAELLSKENQDIVVMDENPEKTESLSSSDCDLMTLNASPTSIVGLKEAGTPQADLFIAVTPSETKNLTCCVLARSLGAKKTVARIDNSEYLVPANRQFFTSLGIDSLIYPETLAAVEIIEGLKRSWARQYWEVHGGALVMLGVKLREEAKELYGKELKDLCGPTAPYHIVAVKRDEQTIIPRGDTEVLVETVLKLSGKSDSEVRILDLCTGSGCILISLLNYSNECHGVGVDLSGKALEVARENAGRLIPALKIQISPGS